MKKTVALILTIAMLALCLAACSSAPAAPSASTDSSAVPEAEKMVINLGSTGYWCNEDMEPAASDTWNGWYIGYYGISQQLFKLNTSFVPEPWLAQSCEQTDDNTWKITLRDNVTFHNGVKMTAESIKNCFERTIKVNERAAAADWIGSFEADGQVLTINTTRPIATVPNELSDPMWIVYYADTEVDYNDGSDYFTGPYVLKSFSAFDETVVVKNENYWGEAPKADEVHFITVADDESAIMALENGEIDMIYPVYSGAVGTLSDYKNIVIDGVTSSRGQFLDFNLKSPATSDINVRTAISMCIDREGYAEKICNGTVTPSYGIFSDALPFGGTDKLKLTVTKLDVDGAKSLLSKAGYTDSNGNGTLDKNGVELDLKLIIRSNDSGMISMCEDLASRLSGIGVNLQITPLESTADTLKAGDYDIACLSYAMAPTGTADYFIKLKFVTGSSQNYGGFSNADVDALVTQMNETTDTGKINDLVIMLQQKVIDECAYVFFAHSKYVVAYSDKLTGFVNNPTEYYCLDENMGLAG
jgi:peptide/nickel transport system substrate-binding protein